MARFQIADDYFRTLCTENLNIGHVEADPKKKNYYSMNIEEFISGTRTGLRSIEEGGMFGVLIDPLTDIKHEGDPNEHEQYLFYILRGFKPGDFAQERESKHLTEQTAKQFIQRMVKDSKEGHPFFNRSFDKADNIRLVAHKIRANIQYVGWQLSFKLIEAFDECYNEANWL